MTLLVLGLICGCSVATAPLTAQFGWSVSGMTTVFALSMIAFTVGNLVAGKLLKRHNVRFVMTVAIAFLLVGFVGSAFASSVVVHMPTAEEATELPVSHAGARAE